MTTTPANDPYFARLTELLNVRVYASDNDPIEASLRDSARGTYAAAKSAIARLQEVVDAFDALSDTIEERKASGIEALPVDAVSRVISTVWGTSSSARASGPAQSHVADMLAQAGQWHASFSAFGYHFHQEAAHHPGPEG
jgi:hypothetical protein